MTFYPNKDFFIDKSLLPYAFTEFCLKLDWVDHSIQLVFSTKGLFQ